jgi:Domain of unknown function (DUF4359)
MKLQPFLIGVAVIAGAMAFSNPNKERYVDYATEEFSKTGKDSICSTNLPSASQQQCKFAISMLSSQGKPLIKQFIDGSTTQKNIVLFSIYTTEMPNQKLTTIAAFGNFIMFK